MERLFADASSVLAPDKSTALPKFPVYGGSIQISGIRWCAASMFYCLITVALDGPSTSCQYPGCCLMYLIINGICSSTK